jgi:hypothetical protein
VEDPRAAIEALASAERYLEHLGAAATVDLAQLDVTSYLRRLVDAELRTATGRPNRLLRVGSDDLIVATSKSPLGRGVPIAWVESAVHRLRSDGVTTIDVATLGYRSAFIGAVLLTIPGATLASSVPPVVRLG